MNSPQHTLQRLRTICLSLPETRETQAWGHPNFRAGTRTFATFERVDGRPSIAFRLEAADVERLCRRRAFFLTPYGRGLWVSLWADEKLDWQMIGKLLQRSYRIVAIKRMMKALEARSSP
jgi:predicted DNA-binding protein (MmcQ/YjbR family)